MGKVLKIGICKTNGDQITSVKEVKAVCGKGLINDRYCKENNNEKCQITLIEIENINHYNKSFGTKFSSINFRRNIVTENINLNNLVGKKFFIGDVKVEGHDLCRPCISLQNKLNEKNIVKEFLHKGGLRCEILSDGKIFIGDKILL